MNDMTIRTKKDRFCPHCDVTMDLHPWSGAGDAAACEIAEKKASLLEQFGMLIR